MATESIIWTALPHGTDASGAVLRLTVFVAPRLIPDGMNGSLNGVDFPGFTNWTALAAAANRQFQVNLRGEAAGSPVQSLGLFAAEPQEFDPELWQALFEGTGVQDRRGESIADQPQATYGANAVYRSLQRRYQTAAITTIDPTIPVTEDERAFVNLQELRAGGERPADKPVEWISPRGRRYQIRPQIEALKTANDLARMRKVFRADNDFTASKPIQVTPFVPLDSRGVMLTEPESPTDREPTIQAASMLAFQDHSLLASQRLSKNRRSADRTAENDFHQMLAALGNFPELLPRLGLAFELLVPLAPGTGRARIQVEPVWNPLIAAEQTSPWTAIDLATNWPAPSPDALSPISNGFLLSSSTAVGRLDLVPVDVEGAVLKLAGMSQADLERHDRLPAVRSSGFDIVRSGQSDIVHHSGERALRNSSRARDRDAELTLYAEDVNRGYRIDAKPARLGQWRSLHELTQSFQLARNGGTRSISDERDTEGFVQLGATTLPADGDELFDTLLVRDSLARWNGWSLSAPRPGRHVGDDGRPASDPDAPNLRGLTVQQRVRPGSLPRLRFGDRYQFRVRTVDLAGNSRSPGETTDIPSPAIIPARSYSVLYGRFEPIDAPVLVPRQALHEGETLERIVLRSRMEFDDQGNYLLAHERHIVPPKTTQFVAESHGRLDASFGTTPAAQAMLANTYAIGLKERGSVNDQTGEGTQFIPMGSEPDNLGYTIHQASGMSLPYLPDPLARGAVLRNLPGVVDDKWGDAAIGGSLTYTTRTFLTGSVTRIAFGADATWPDFHPFRLRIVEKNSFAAPVWDANARELSIFLPPGEQIEVGLRSYVLIGDLEALGMWQWVEDGLADPALVSTAIPDSTNRRKQLAEAGDLWFLTPERRLTLVHAVQKPLLTPVIERITPIRAAGQTFVELDNRIKIDARSTAKIDLLARWKDPETPAEQPPLDVFVRDQEISRPANAGLAASVNTDQAVNWDRKNQLTLTSYGAAEGEATLGGDPVTSTGASAGVDPAAPRPPMRHDFGDTKHRWVTYRVVATTRFRDYFPAAVTADAANITRTSDETEVNVFSSAQPASLSLRCAIPAFRWTQDAESSLDQQRDRWGGIRVHFDGPWYSSGADEQLAVVLWSPEPASWPPPEWVRGSVSRWGRDPIWRGLAHGGSDFATVPLQSHFPLRVPDPNGDARRYYLRGFETLGKSFAVAAHEVTFHDDGHLSCDIQIKPGNAYFPFIRLALARFQPYSVEGLHLSPVLLTEFLQLAPHRNVSLSSAPGGSDRVKLTVTGEVAGQALNPASVELDRNTIEVTLEQRIPGTTGDLGWEPASFPGAAQITPPAALFDGVLWQGDIPLPSPREPGQYRLAIREFEHLETDNDTGFQQGQRLVFADTIMLP